MELGISLDAYLKTTTAEKGILRLASIGFDAVDLNLSDYCQEDSPLASHGWRGWIEGIGAAAGEAGLELSQAYAPIYFYDLDEEGIRFRARNVEQLGEWADRAARCGVSVAIENLFRFERRRFATYVTGPDELTDLIDRIGRPNVAACLDTGHSFVSGIEPAEFVRALGDIGYPGVFSLEVHCQVQNMPEPLIDRAVEMVHAVGRHFIGT